MQDRYEARDNLLRPHKAASTAIHHQALPLSVTRIKTSPSSRYATIYIEGDGFAYLSRGRPTNDPTPKTPVALKLAVQDPADSVYYFARPCQYINDNTPCPQRYWTTHRYARKVVESFDSALNRIKGDHPHIKGFHLVGFSGGGNIAGLLAAQRDDIQSFRTVAGNLDNDFFTDFHEVSAMPYSLNMADEADILYTIPQVHFISENDKFVPPPIAQSYLRQLPSQQCVKTITVEDTTHLDGWAGQWQALLKVEPACRE